jgi:hypothetical protein
MPLAAKYAARLYERLKSLPDGKYRRAVQKRLYYLCFGGSIHRMRERVPL